VLPPVPRATARLRAQDAARLLRATITPGQAELLDRPKGMPCVTCILLSPAEGDAQHVNGTDLLGIA
jgi:hypothetical protein